MSILVLQSSQWERESLLLCFVCLSGYRMIVMWLFLMMPWVCLQFVIVVSLHFVFLKSCDCLRSVAFPHGAMVWYVVCDCHTYFLIQPRVDCETVTKCRAIYFPQCLSNIWLHSSNIWAAKWDFQQCVSATSKGSDQPAHTCNLIRAFACRLNILWLLSYWSTVVGDSKLNRRLHMLV